MLFLGLELDGAIAGHFSLHQVEKLVEVNQTVVVVPQLRLLPYRLLFAVFGALLSGLRTTDELILLRRWLLCAIQTEGNGFLDHDDLIFGGWGHLPPLNKLHQLFLSEKRVFFEVAEADVLPLLLLLLLLWVSLYSAAQEGLPYVLDLVEGCGFVGEVGRVEPAIAFVAPLV